MVWLLIWVPNEGDMKKLVTVVAAIAAFSFVNAASAADMPVKAGPAPVAAAFSWTGFYLGGDIGYGSAKSDGLALNAGGVPGSGPAWSTTSNGVLGGVFGGGNYQMGKFVVGAEADWQAASLSGSTNVVNTGTTYLISSKVTSYGSARGRLGYAQDRWLLFVTGGWAWATWNNQYGFPGAAPIWSPSFHKSGATVGAGVDYAITNNIFARGEYRYTSLNSATDVFLPGNASEQGNKVKINDVRLGIAVKFP